tara:strand:- start:2060 stop:2911 length:852 start_codon:yes stop_codon:yes gene_type:complete
VSKILLTGSSGFIGSNLLENFSKNNEITLVVRKNVKKNIKSNKNIKIIKFNDYDELHYKLKKIKIDIVIHCATHYVKNHNYKDIDKLIESNILLGNIILENIKIMKVKKFINFSTVWEGNFKINGFINLYSSYKKAFSSILNYYKITNSQTKFFELMLSDTYGSNDQRQKLINILRKNYQKNITTRISSKNLYLNLLNVEDIVSAVEKILNIEIKPGKFVLKNNRNYKVFDIIKFLNKQSKKKIKIIWNSNILIKNKIFNYDELKGWSPKKSKINDIINLITK